MRRPIGLSALRTPIQAQMRPMVEAGVATRGTSHPSALSASGVRSSLPGDNEKTTGEVRQRQIASRPPVTH